MADIRAVSRPGSEDDLHAWLLGQQPKRSSAGYLENGLTFRNVQNSLRKRRPQGRIQARVWKSEISLAATILNGAVNLIAVPVYLQ